MSKGLYVVGTGTDVGKTYISALLLKALRRGGYDAGYYKAVVSGAPSFAESDAAFVNSAAGIGEPQELLLSYRYAQAYSPHLAARLEGNPVEKSEVLRAWQAVCAAYPYVTVEGCGGIVCPIRIDATHRWYLTDLIRWLGLPSVIVSPAGLGSINAAALTAFYMKAQGLPVKGFIVNNYGDTLMERDNVVQIQELTNLPVLACVSPNQSDIGLSPERVASLYA